MRRTGALTRTSAAIIIVVLLVLAGGAYLAVVSLGPSQPTTSTPTPTEPSSTASSSALSSSAPATPTSASSSSTTSPASSSTLVSSTTSSSTQGALNGNWTTYHEDNSRTGYEQMPNVTGATRGWVSAALDQQVYAEPLVLGQSVFVATENDSVYALNALSGSVLWRTNLGTPVPQSALPCGDIFPLGITSTPVIDVATSTLYVVTFQTPAHHVLYGLNIDTGTVVSQAAVDPPGASPTVEQQRGALTLANGVVYIPYGGLAGDCGQYHGWVVGVKTNGTAGLLTYEVPTGREGGIWAPSGVTIGSGGDVYVAVGNGNSTSTFDYSESVIKLSPTLKVLDYFAASNWLELNQGDVDVGSLAPTMMPNGDIFQIGKEGFGYLISGSNLGGIGGQIFSLQVCNGAWGGTARVGELLFLPCSSQLVEVKVSGTTFSIGWHGGNFTNGDPTGTPIVTGNVVWAVDTPSGRLMGFDISTGQQLFSFSTQPADHFITPAAGDGRLFVASGNELYSFVVG